MSTTMYFVDDVDKFVFTYTADGDNRWSFSRMSQVHKERSKDKFVLSWDESNGGEWNVRDASAKLKLIGRPCLDEGTPKPTVVAPPLGPWLLWGVHFTLMLMVPPHPPLPINHRRRDLAFGSITLLEHDCQARLCIKMNSTPIDDASLEAGLAFLRDVLRNLARRPDMTLFIHSDARDAAVPALRHVKRMLAFVQESGAEFVLVGRGHVIVLKTRTLFGAAILKIVKLLQRITPAPWPEHIAPSLELAEDWLVTLGAIALPLMESI